jgi:hypothetical protein
MEAIKQAFADSKGQSRSALLAYVTAGYPTIQETPDIMLAMQAGGVGTCLIEQHREPLYRRRFTQRPTGRHQNGVSILTNHINC